MDQVIMNKFEELYQKINTLEKSIHDNSNPSIIVRMDVKNLHLQELNLDELAFHLDKLDIKELSGMLNLGNTFSPMVHTKTELENPSAQKIPLQQKVKKNKSDDIQVKINGKPVPYTLD